MKQITPVRFLTTAIAAGVLLSGCGWDDTSTDFGTALAPSAAEITADAQGVIANHAPRLAGAPATSASIDQLYDFTPQASDADGGSLTFSINNKPGWASFDSLTGRLLGTPHANDVGTYNDIIIGVSDGRSDSTLTPFTINVSAPLAAADGAAGRAVGGGAAGGSAKLSWQRPEEKTDGSAADDLAGYRVYFGQDAAALKQWVQIEPANVTQYEFTSLSNGTWYFSVSAVTRDGIESGRSEVGSKTIG